MPTTLHQIIALQGDAKKNALRALTDSHRDLQKPQLLGGQRRRYTPLDDAAPAHAQPADQVQLVQLRADEELARVASALSTLFDLVATKDASNCEARADVVLDGTVLLPDVPVTYLLFLEKQLVDLRTYVEKLPVNDPAAEWNYNDSTGVWETPPVTTISNAKVMRNHELAPATKEHPAQVSVYTEDVPVGTWHTVRHSGALPATRVAELTQRVSALQDAVKMAREKANTRPVVDRTGTGRVVFTYLFQ